MCDIMKKSNNLFRKKEMGIIVNKENNNDELSRRINADIRAKAMETVNIDDEVSDPDFAEGSEYVRNFQKTSRFGWIWIVLILLAIASVLAIVFM